MAYAENLLSTTQTFLTPEYLSKFSAVLGQPIDKVQAGLKAVLPTFLLGLFNKGSSTEGADSIVRMVQSDFGQISAPGNINDSVYLQKGEEVVNDIFGNNLSSVTNSLGSTTGLGSSGIKKMMGMIAPVVMGVVGNKIRREGMGAKGLAGFFSQQRSMISSFIPSGLSTLVGIGGVSAAAASVKRSVAGKIPVTDRSRPMGARWLILALIALLLIGFFYWISANRVEETAATQTRTEPVELQPVPAQPSAAPVALGQLGAFLAAGNEAELPKRFSFRNLNFISGSASLSAASNPEIDQIVAAMKQYPDVTARIEGFTDNSGDPGINQTLSDARAMSVRDILVGKGIDPARLEATGRGQDAPISSNDSEEGRALNRRIEFVVTGLK